MNDGGLEGKLKIDRKVIRWHPPKWDWIKINFDGTSKGNKGLSSVGAVARNGQGDIIGFVAKRLVDGTNNVNKIEVAFLVVLLA